MKLKTPPNTSLQKKTYYIIRASSYIYAATESSSDNVYYVLRPEVKENCYVNKSYETLVEATTKIWNEIETLTDLPLVCYRVNNVYLNVSDWNITIVFDRRLRRYSFRFLTSAIGILSSPQASINGDSLREKYRSISIA